MVACNDANGLSADTGASPAALYHKPVDLSAKAKTVIKLYSDGTTRSYMKAQCMHCLDPACASACMLGALQKREFGIVTYDPDLCVGCRYCEVGCPFGVPKFEWAKAAPKIVKCELCKERLKAGQEPACTDVCPRNAVIFGTRSELLKEAKRRIAESPARYVPKVYGETDGGGTQVLYLSSVVNVMNVKQSIDAFLAEPALAVVGVSRSGAKFGNVACRELRAKGYRVYPIHPGATTIDGVRCYSRLEDLPEPVNAMLVVVPPSEAAQVVRDAARTGIRHVWLQQGAESTEVLAICREVGVDVVSGECVLMFAHPTGFHKAHRWLRSLVGSVPA